MFGLLEVGTCTKIFIALIAIYIIWFIQRNLVPSDPKYPPLVPSYLPFFGSMFAFGVNPMKFLHECYKKYGPVFSFIMFGKTMTYVIGPEGNNFFFNVKANEVSAEIAYKHLTTPVFGDGVVYDVPHEVLMEQKKVAKNGLTIDNFTHYVPLIEAETMQYLALHWAGDQGEVDLLTSVSELTILTASRCLLGKEIRHLVDESVATLFEHLDGGFQPINFLFPNLPLPSYKRRDIANQKMTSLYLEAIKRRRETGDVSNRDLLQCYMDNVWKDGTKMKDEHVAHMMIALLMAGQHTSSTTGTWMGLYIAANPEVKKKIIEEREKILGEKIPPLSYEVLSQFEYLQRVLKETLRLNPPIVTLMRAILSDQEFNGKKIPAGNFLCCSQGLTHILPELWSSPESFNPDRYLPGIEEDVKAGKQNAYFPFGGGRHRCIGDPFAYLQIKTFWTTILKYYDIELVGKFPKADTTKLIILPERPCKIRYTRRKDVNTTVDFKPFVREHLGVDAKI